MPAMVGRVVTLDFSVWSGGGLGLMAVRFPADPPADPGHRYTLPLKPVLFPHPDSTPQPDAAPLPFLTAVVQSGERRAIGSYVLDTGAQITIISLRIALAAGLDENGNGSVDDEAESFLPIGGIGGTVQAPVLALDWIALPTDQGISLIFGPLSVVVLDIHPIIDGVLGSDVLTAGWLPALFGGPDGYLRQIHFDFRSYPEELGSMILDVTPERDEVTPGTGPEDVDGDGIEDTWERFYFADITTNGPDSDGDGWLDRLEFIHNSDPSRSNSVPVFRMESGPGEAHVVYHRFAELSNATVRAVHAVDLGDWAPVNASTAEVERVDIFTERVRLALPDLPGERGYLRLEVLMEAP
jgi:hypothetical protein